jgi:hypothetical protein
VGLSNEFDQHRGCSQVLGLQHLLLGFVKAAAMNPDDHRHVGASDANGRADSLSPFLHSGVLAFTDGPKEKQAVDSAMKREAELLLK